MGPLYVNRKDVLESQIRVKGLRGGKLALCASVLALSMKPKEATLLRIM